MAKKETKKDAPAKAEPKASEQKPAANMPLFYSNPVPLDAKAHADLALKQNFGFGFTEGVNAVPLNLIEMPQVCHYYPIAFSPDGNATPV
ncbi:MAG TPA: SapC family protein, partial [Alphaproteobacteria bacterium]|nr:SapC family protein [Alphaproteobacteria bacterium]